MDDKHSGTPPATAAPPPSSYGQRPAREGETCTCGRRAIVVYITERYGAVPYCGVPGDAPPDGAA